MSLIFNFLKLFALISLINQTNCSNSSNVIYLNEKSSHTIRLKSVLSLNDPVSDNKLQKIFWSFKRIYLSPPLNNKTLSEISQIELMISLDSEVQDNLKLKYAISDHQPNTFDLIISNLTFADTGIYKCNLWNQRTIFYHLTVSSPLKRPELILEDGNLIKEFSDLTLRCLSKHSYPYPSIKWFLNGKDIQLSGLDTEIGYRLVDKEVNQVESVLKLRNVRSELHKSNLTCKLSQSVDEAQNEQKLMIESEVVTLNVAFKPIVSLEAFKNKLQLDLRSIDKKMFIYKNCDDVVFKCLFKSNPTDNIQIKWFINNSVHSVHSNTSTDEFKCSEISNLPTEFNLTCQVENTIGKASFTVPITLLHEPEIKLDRVLYDLDEGSQFQLNCTTNSSPVSLKTEWRRYSVNQTDNYETISNNSLLEFKSVNHKENSGVYVCVSLNQMNDSFGLEKIGENSHKIELNIRFSPLMNVVSKKLASDLNQTLRQNISCMTMSNPRPEFNWYKNGAKLNTNQPGVSKYQSLLIEKSKNLYESILVVNRIDEFDLNKSYECEALNELGSNRVSVELVPLSKPDKPTELRALYVDFMTITFGWSPGFDGGLDQVFVMQVNDSLIELDSLDNQNGFLVSVNGPGLLNITFLNLSTMYSIRLMARNRLGQSDWSDYILVRTSDITEADRDLLPVFDTLFLNVPNNRLEFKFKSLVMIPICVNISVLSDKDVNQVSNSCLVISDLKQNEFQLDQTVLKLTNSNSTQTEMFSSKNVKNLKVSVCFQLKQSLCSTQTNAIIDSYDKLSNLNSKNTGEADLNKKFSKFMRKPANSATNTAIPLALIIGISVCILALLILLFITIIYCIRKRNFKLCKALLQSKQGAQGLNNDCEKPKTIGITDPNVKSSHTNKTFNIDIGSISAPVASTVSLSGSHMTNSTSSDLNGNNLQVTTTRSNSRRVFTANLTQTATNIVNNSIGRSKINEILVTEDEDQQNKIMTQGVSNCSPSSGKGSRNTPFIFTDYNLFDQQQGLNYKGGSTGSRSASGSNSDPIAINNSLHSNSTTDSPIYGYNVADATNAHSLAVNNFNGDDNSDLMYMKQIQQQYVTNGYQMNEDSSGEFVRQQSSFLNYNKQANGLSGKSRNFVSNANGYLIEQPSESGYSTPSRPKKVVYEVIV